MEQNRLPKNIRQIGEKEDWIRVYIEDYVHTYIQRLRGLQEGGTAGGILLGRKQRINGVMHLFIRGAIVAADPFWRDREQTPKGLKEEGNMYFPGMEICGFFVSSREDRPSEVDLVRIFETHFSSEYQILFNVRKQEEEVFSFSGHGMVRLSGYYIYYEKNEEMQSYIIRKESLRAMEEKQSAQMAADREIKKEDSIIGSAGKKNRKESGKDAFANRKREPLWKKRDDDGRIPGAFSKEVPPGKEKKKLQKGDLIVRLVSIAGIFILAFILFSDQLPFKKSGQENAAGFWSGLLGETNAVQAGADSDFISQLQTEAESGSVQGSNETQNRKEEESSQAESISSSQETENGDTSRNNPVNASEGGNGQESSASQEETLESRNTAGGNRYVFPMKYLVKKGDSLYSISEKYYGNTDMVDAICLENNISNPAKLQYGTLLTLPAR